MRFLLPILTLLALAALWLVGGDSYSLCGDVVLDLYGWCE